MTGQEFKRLVVMCGTQASVARVMGVEADTIRARYQEDVIPAIYELAIIGLVLKAKLPPLVELAEIIGKISENEPNK